MMNILEFFCYFCLKKLRATSYFVMIVFCFFPRNAIFLTSLISNFRLFMPCEFKELNE